MSNIILKHFLFKYKQKIHHNRGAATGWGDVGICPPPTLKYRGTSYVLVPPPTFTTKSNPYIHTIVAAPLYHSYCSVNSRCYVYAC